MKSKCYKHEWGEYWKTRKGMLHRENDLPAVEESDGYKGWYINGKRHRELGPARIWLDGMEEWYLNGIQYFPETMPNKLFLEYLRWEYRKKNGI